MALTRTISAFNTATASENKIHDDAVASRFGFTGGLVPGVDVFAYLAHMPMAQWGKDWLASGFMQARLLKPCYDGDEATVSATIEVDSLSLSISARGDLCANGMAKRLGSAVPAALLPSGVMPDHDNR